MTPPSVSTPIQFTVYGSPRTKKTHSSIRIGRGRPRLFPSGAWMRWVKGAQVVPRVARLPERPYNCTAIFYRKQNSGDAVGFYQGLADAFEKWGILSNDRWITQWDGSRLDKDAAQPRVEVTLTPI